MASSYIQPQTAFDVNMQDSGAISLNAKILKPLDEVLRCHICFDYFSNCMMTKCSHNYCSVCIRRYMTYKSQCPTCFQEATEPELQNNRLVDEILRIYKKIRETLQIPADSRLFPDQTSSSKIASDDFEKPSETKASTKAASKQQTSEISTSDEVSCPVCYITVPNSRINIHLDSCLIKQSEERNPRKFLPKLVYHLLTDKEIRKKLKEHGLNTTGNRQALIRRHKNFIILFNANCDSLNPKPVSDLLIEIERQELEERIHASQRSTQVNKKSDPSVIEKEHETYVEENKSQFNALIQDVQQRILAQKPVKEEVDMTEETSNITDKYGNVVGESTLTVGSSSHLKSVPVKEEEFSESLLEEPFLRSSFSKVEKDKSENITIDEKKSNSGFKNTSQLQFRIKKEVPTVKMKEGSPSLLDMTTNQELTTDPSSVDDFGIGKISVNRYQKKKYARRLSTEEKGSQRKK